MSEKARYWVGVCYPENMKDDWKDTISKDLQLPYCYCVHDKCCTTSKDERKIHVHIMIAFPNTSTKKTALKLFNKLSKDPLICCPSCEEVHNIRFMYEYLIHNTEDSKKKGKYLYDPKERVSGNCFDIGSYEQISSADKLNMALELSDLIIQEDFENLKRFYMYVRSNMDLVYFEVAKSNSSWFSALCKSNFLENHSRR